jgi:uncharacterized protein with GYD domain
MPTFVTTIRFTEQGVKEVGQTTQRATAFGAAARQIGANVLHQFWTTGEFDGLIVFDAPDDETATTLTLRLAAQGYVRTTTCRAFTAAEMTKVLAGV